MRRKTKNVPLIKLDANREVVLFLNEIKGKRVEHIVKTIITESVEDLLNLIGVKNKSKEDKKKTISYVIWQGTTEDGFFRAVFYTGTIVVIFSEREMCLDTIKGYNIACTLQFYELMNINDRMDESLEKEELKSSLSHEYMLNKYQTDVDNIDFKDIMAILGWKYKRNAFIDEDIVGLHAY